MCGKIWSRHVRERLTLDNDNEVEVEKIKTKSDPPLEKLPVESG